MSPLSYTMVAPNSDIESFLLRQLEMRRAVTWPPVANQMNTSQFWENATSLGPAPVNITNNLLPLAMFASLQVALSPALPSAIAAVPASAPLSLSTTSAAPVHVQQAMRDSNRPSNLAAAGYKEEQQQQQQEDTQEKTLIPTLGSTIHTRSSRYVDVLEKNDVISKASTLKSGKDSFPMILHKLLRDAGENGFGDICSFFSHGRAFRIGNFDLFNSKILPHYFKGRPETFKRQLGFYGFIRIVSGPDAGGWYHPLFLLSRPELCVHIKRVALPWSCTANPSQNHDRRKCRVKLAEGADPNFYAMKPATPDASENSYHGSRSSNDSAGK